MISDFTIRLFAWSVFPLGFVLFVALIGSRFCCEWLARGVIKTIDAILFCSCGKFQHSEVSFFWAVFVVCLVIMGSSAISFFETKEHISDGDDWYAQLYCPAPKHG